MLVRINADTLHRAAVQAHHADEAHDKGRALAHYTAQRDEAEQRLNRYRFALLAHDWGYEFSDCGRTWERGRDERKALEAERAAIDKDSSVWNSLCPAAHRRGA